MSTTSVIQAIDSTTGLVTLKNEDGTLDTIYCGPEVKRFDALKVGDKVTFRSYESIVYAIAPANAAAQTTGLPQLIRTAGAKPGATISQQQTAVDGISRPSPIPSNRHRRLLAEPVTRGLRRLDVCTIHGDRRGFFRVVSEISGPGTELSRILSKKFRNPACFSRQPL